ncbi:unnamed protein product [Linum trigynum]|uniref:Uncharacterized protein n=1 Tax=Linum trigynum TaxID=586398 RepID=A0AAV2FFK5_9ROSI
MEVSPKVLPPIDPRRRLSPFRRRLEQERRSIRGGDSLLFVEGWSRKGNRSLAAALSFSSTAGAGKAARKGVVIRFSHRFHSRGACFPASPAMFGRQLPVELGDLTPSCPQQTSAGGCIHGRWRQNEKHEEAANAESFSCCLELPE